MMETISFFHWWSCNLGGTSYFQTRTIWTLLSSCYLSDDKICLAHTKWSRLVCVSKGLLCLDLDDSLQETNFEANLLTLDLVCGLCLEFRLQFFKQNRKYKKIIGVISFNMWCYNMFVLHLLIHCELTGYSKFFMDVKFREIRICLLYLYFHDNNIRLISFPGTNWNTWRRATE